MHRLAPLLMVALLSACSGARSAAKPTRVPLPSISPLTIITKEWCRVHPSDAIHEPGCPQYTPGAPGPSPTIQPTEKPKSRHWSGDERTGYTTAYEYCQVFSPKQVNRGLKLHAFSNASTAVASAYAEQYLMPSFQAGGYAGCLDAFLHKPSRP